MLPDKPSLCFLCEYYVAGTDPENLRGKPTCRSFPEGIPNEILNEGFDHRRPLGKESILFKLRGGLDESDLKAWEDEVLAIEKEDMLGMLDQVGPDEI